MRVLIVGGGSIGARHTENAAKLSDAVAILDTDFKKSNALASRLQNVIAIKDIHAAINWCPTHVIVATPHNTHINIAQKFLNIAQHILIEKPISNTLQGVDKFLDTAHSQNTSIHVVCNMRFHPAIKTLHSNLHKIGTIFFSRSQYGNYLPNMRPQSVYKALYCAHKAQGGGVILDAIHEIDYLTHMFGPVSRVHCEASKLSELDIDVEDYASLVLKHENNIRSEVHLDYLQQYKSRGCEIVGYEGTLIWNSEGKNPEKCTVQIFEKSNHI